MKNHWIVVTDFDGTLTVRDIGNELCDEILGEVWRKLYSQLRTGELDLKNYQKQVWSYFPTSQKRFIEASLKYSALRPGVNEFLEKARKANIPVYVASCGLRPYIEATLKTHLSPEAYLAIHEIRCNEVEFSESRIEKFIPPLTSETCPFPLDKGAWAKELSNKTRPRPKIFGIGNGTSDQSFHGAVDALAATEGLEKWCQKQKVNYISFHDFNDLLKAAPIF